MRLTGGRSDKISDGGEVVTLGRAILDDANEAILRKKRPVHKLQGPKREKEGRTAKTNS